MVVSRGPVRRTFPDVLGMLDAVPNLFLIAFVCFGHESLVKSRPEVIEAQRVFAAQVQQLWTNG